LKLEFNFNQSGVIPFRKTPDGLEILLITSIRKKKWVIPKGYIEFNLSPFESAKKEAFEEAGVRGSNETYELGTYKIQKAAGICMVRIYSLEATGLLEEYPEKNLRSRKWFSLKDAINNISIPAIPEMILKLEKQLSVLK
jgi:8-oxo-dGTP pyrophosphatase MutT (NUDIX family)